MSGQVHQSVQDGVLVLTLDNPPVNASSQDIRTGIVAGIERLAGDPALVGAVLVGARDSFVAGSDISEFGGAVPEPLLPAVIAAIEECPKPVVAALDGFALGGGLELALACDVRIATPHVQVGLPEVTLGMVPGAGGTQRLPRLTGRAAALSLILSGRRISGTEAHDLGIVDELVEGDLLQEAIKAAGTSAKRRVKDLPVPEGEDDLDGVAARAVRGTHRPNVVAAVQLVKDAGVIEVNEALRHERTVFDELRVAPDASALRHIFFAERAATRRAGIKPDSSTLTRVGVIGAGAMGAGIGAAFALAGVAVHLVDANAEQAQAGLDRVRQSIEKAVGRGRLTEEQGAARIASLGASTQIADLAGTDLVIEAVVESIAVKTAVLRDAASAAPRAVLATNTSYLSVAELGDTLDAPERLIGMHFFNPADVMKLVEIIPDPASSDEAIALALGAAKLLGKVAVLAGDTEGFIGNRIYSVYRRHAEYLLEDGATPAEVDAAMEEFGFAMGPFAVADLSGLQIAQSLRQRWRDTGRLPARYVEIPDILCERGWLGRRTERGYHRYEEGKRTVDPEVLAIIEAESERKGIERRSISPQEIVDRLLGAMVVEGARVVREGTARHIDDVDVAVVNGFGFPRFAGGPLWWARQQDAATRNSLAAAVAEAAREDVVSARLEDVIRDE